MIRLTWVERPSYNTVFLSYFLRYQFFFFRWKRWDVKLSKFIILNWSCLGNSLMAPLFLMTVKWKISWKEFNGDHYKKNLKGKNGGEHRALFNKLIFHLPCALIFFYFFKINKKISKLKDCNMLQVYWKQNVKRSRSYQYRLHIFIIFFIKCCIPFEIFFENMHLTGLLS